MSNTKELQVGSVVTLKSGSPQMVIVELPTKPGRPARCQHWDFNTQSAINQPIPVSSIETAENHIARERRFHEMMQRNPSVEIPEGVSEDRVLVITFDSIEDKEQFVQDSFGGVSNPTQIH